jgi:hypothetical protein
VIKGIRAKSRRKPLAYFIARLSKASMISILLVHKSQSFTGFFVVVVELSSSTTVHRLILF